MILYLFVLLYFLLSYRSRCVWFIYQYSAWLALGVKVPWRISVKLKGTRPQQTWQSVNCVHLGYSAASMTCIWLHDDVIEWKDFPRSWPFVQGIHRSPVSFPHKGHWRGALMFSLICVWINGGINNREAGNLRRYRAHYDVTVMLLGISGVVVFSQRTWKYDFSISAHSWINVIYIYIYTYIYISDIHLCSIHTVWHSILNDIRISWARCHGHHDTHNFNNPFITQHIVTCSVMRLNCILIRNTNNAFQISIVKMLWMTANLPFCI